MSRIIRKFIKMVGNEKCSPILFPYEAEMIEEVTTLVDQKNKEVESFKENMGKLQQIEIKMCQAMELEILRINYLIQLYHSTRFNKIQSLVEQMKKPQEDFLSPFEMQFVNDLIEAFDAAMGSSMTEIEWTESNGDENKFVYFKVLKQMSAEQMSSNENSEPIELSEKAIGLAHFYKVQDHLIRGEFQLV